jgi:hypothetical protein
MPLQNRVNPFGEIVENTARGTIMGNRGVIHKNKKIIKPFKTKYWITCVLKYKNVQRAVMTENRYTELFFLDEATSFAAGHRPCAYCRNKDYKLFKKLWLQANANTFQLNGYGIAGIDEILHAERISRQGSKHTYHTALSLLPNAVMVKLDNESAPYLYYNKQLLQWSLFGYTTLIRVKNNIDVEVLTPKSIVKIFEAGYMCNIHASAKALLGI